MLGGRAKIGALAGLLTLCFSSLGVAQVLAPKYLFRNGITVGQREIGFVLRKHPCLTQGGQTVYLDQGALIETVQRPYIRGINSAGKGTARSQDKQVQTRPDSG